MNWFNCARQASFTETPTLHKLSDALCFRTIATEDIGNTYVDWMNDLDVTVTPNRIRKNDPMSIVAYIEKVAQSSSDLMYGIYENSEHIGTIKLGNINPRHLTADLSYLIGSKKH